MSIKHCLNNANKKPNCQSRNPSKLRAKTASEWRQVLADQIRIKIGQEALSYVLLANVVSVELVQERYSETLNIIFSTPQINLEVSAYLIGPSCSYTSLILRKQDPGVPLPTNFPADLIPMPLSQDGMVSSTVFTLDTDFELHQIPDKLVTAAKVLHKLW